MKILTVILILVMGMLTLSLISVIFYLNRQTRKGQSVAGVHFRKGDIEQLLAQGKPAAARDAALKWKAKEPCNTTACMLLIKAQFRLQAYVEAKAVIEELVNLAPEFEFQTRNYLSRINEALSNHRPHAVE